MPVIGPVKVWRGECSCGYRTVKLHRYHAPTQCAECGENLEALAVVQVRITTKGRENE